MLSLKQIEDVCLVNDSTYKKCRYLAMDESDWTKFHCLKKSGKKADIDLETKEFIRDARKKGKDPYQENVPLSDNCDGYPIFKHITQGYDI